LWEKVANKFEVLLFSSFPLVKFRSLA
jgi:hypothetical protein